MDKNDQHLTGLPAGWTAKDLRFLLQKLEEGVEFLIADLRLGIPSIHGFSAHVRHLGYGLMKATTPEYTITFDAGAAMQRTPGGEGWTTIHVKQGEFPYDTDKVRKKLESWLEIAEGWRLTQREYQDRLALVAGGVPVLNAEDRRHHEEMVRQALERGEEVPVYVLEDYPDLLATGTQAEPDETPQPEPKPVKKKAKAKRKLPDDVPDVIEVDCGRFVGWKPATSLRTRGRWLYYRRTDDSEDRERRVQLAGRGMVWREPVPVAAQAAA